MLIFGHVGLTLGAAKAADREGGLRTPALLSLLPDMIDKPIFAFWPGLVNDSSRSFAHSLLGAALALAALAALGLERRRTLLLWGCYAGHLLLDRMWLPDSIAILLWPLRGSFPPPPPGAYLHGQLMLYNVCGEALGLLVLLYLARRQIVTRNERA